MLLAEKVELDVKHHKYTGMKVISEFKGTVT